MYGGTKEEMERLIEDAAKMTDAQKELGIEVEAGNMSFANIANAISVVQKNMGIMGTTAKEASETISGSVASAKASWQNLLVGFANDEANLNDLIGQFVESVKTAAGNIIPTFTKALTGVGEAVKQIAPIISEELPGIIESVLPNLLAAGTSLVSGLLNGIVQALPTIANSAVQIVDSLITSLVGLLPMVLSSGGQMITTLASGIFQTLQTQLPVIAQAGIDILQNLANGFASNIPSLLEKILPMVLSFTETLRANFGQIVDAGIDLILKLVDGFIDGLPTLIAYIPTIITNITGLINDNLPKIIAAGVTIIGKLVVGFIQAIPTIIANLPQIINAIVNTFTAFNWLNLGKSIITGLGNGLKSMVSFVKNIGSQLIDAIKGGFSKLPSEMLNIGKNIVQGVWNGIKGMIGWFKSQIKNFFSGIVSSVKSVLGIHSPSKVFAGIGGFMAEGLGEGWDDAYSKIERDINKDLDFSGNITTSGNYNGYWKPYGTALSGATFNITVNGANIQDDQSLAERIAFEIQQMVDRKEAVFGAA